MANFNTKMPNFQTKIPNFQKKLQILKKLHFSQFDKNFGNLTKI